MTDILQICPDYFRKSLYSKLFFALSESGINSKIYVPDLNLGVRGNENVYTLDKKYGIIDRILYFRKQNHIYRNICEKVPLATVDGIHAHTLFSAGYAAYRIHKRTGIPYTVAVRNTDVNLFFKYMIHLREIGRQIMKSAEKIVFISPSYKKIVCNKYIPSDYRELILNKSLVIQNGIDDYFLNNKYYRSNFKDKSVVKLVYVGEISSNKNLDIILKACPYLMNKGYNVSLTVIGEILENKYNRIFNTLPFLTYKPKSSQEKILSYMREADIFVMVSFTETFGLVYPEAMSQGLPVIYTSGQGFDNYFLDGQVGYAVDCRDYKMLADRIIRIVDDYDSISRKCVESVDIFNWKNIAMIYKDIYTKVF